MPLSISLSANLKFMAEIEKLKAKVDKQEVGAQRD